DPAVEVDVALARLAPGGVDELGDGAADGSHAGARGIERARGRHQDGEIAVGPLALEAADHVVGPAPHEHRADLGEEGRERVLDALAVTGEPVELVVRAGDEPVERRGEESADARHERMSYQTPISLLDPHARR